MERLRYAALMHDIGKLIVPNQLLNKPGRLTESEFERVKRHESVSVELLRRIDFLAPVAGDTTTEAATAAVDGTGLVEPAIIHVADAFDAMTSTRSYRRALSQETAFAELRDGAGHAVQRTVRRRAHRRDRTPRRARTAPATRSTCTSGRSRRPRPAPARPASATSSPRSRAAEAREAAGSGSLVLLGGSALGRDRASSSPTRAPRGRRSRSSAARSQPAS